MNDTGPIYGREAIVKHWADVFKQIQFSNHLDKRDRYSPHIIGTAGNEAWSNGEWSTTLKGEKFGPVDAKGNWIEIYRREGDTWKKRLDMWNVTPAPLATAATTPVFLVCTCIGSNGRLCLALGRRQYAQTHRPPRRRGNLEMIPIEVKVWIMKWIPRLQHSAPGFFHITRFAQSSLSALGQESGLVA